MVAKRSRCPRGAIARFTLAQFNMVAKRISTTILNNHSFTLAQFNMVAKHTRIKKSTELGFTLAQFNMVAKPQIYSIILS